MTAAYNFMDLLSQNKELIGHFTKFNNLESIITPSGIKFWATRFDYFEDHTEYSVPLKKLFSLITSQNPSWGRELDQDYKVYPYILSFTKNIFSPYLWENYGDNNAGIVLIFKKSRLYDYCHKFISETGKIRYCGDVIYVDVKDDFNIKIEEVVTSLNKDFQLSNDANLRIEASAFIKSYDSYHKEEEFRLIHGTTNCFTATPQDPNLRDRGELVNPSVKYRSTNLAQNVPYITIEFPLDFLEGIYIGKNVTAESLSILNEVISNCDLNIKIYRQNVN